MGLSSVKPVGARVGKIAALIMTLGMISACADSGSETARLERRMDELAREIRQVRAETQRGNEKLIAALQEHFSQSGLSSPAMPSGPATPVDPARGMEASRALQAAQNVMSERMSAAPLTGDPDRDFLAQMVPHHEGAVEMSKVLLKDGLRPEVRRLAQEIIAHQQSEIELMKRWLAAVSR